IGPPAAMTGSLVGGVVDPGGVPVEAHVVIRDDDRVIVRECDPVQPRAGGAGGRFEVRGLPPGFYSVEIAAPGFQRDVRANIWVEASAVTSLGTVCLRESGPSQLPQPMARAHGPPRGVRRHR